MRRQLFLVALTLTAACSQGGEDSVANPELRSFDVAEEPPPATSAPGAGGGQADAGTAVQVAMPKIAYTYRYTFRLSSDAVASIQEKHLALCQSLGPARCRVVDMRRSASSGDYVEGTLKLQVAAPVAREFGERLVSAATKDGAETIDRSISGEDLSKQIVDTAARIRTKEALVERLTTLLDTRSGNIAQAVEAERAINSAQEELEQARAWLAEMRGRVSMSTFEIGYTSGAPLAGGVSDPLRDAFGGVGDLFGRSLALIITLIAALLPWALLGLLIWWAGGLVRRKMTRADADDADDPVDGAPPVTAES
jgi:hypothetical protein